MKNKLGREVLEKPYEGLFEHRSVDDIKLDSKNKSYQKYDNIEKLFDDLEIKDGMTLSFHHHLRNGDYVLNMVMEEVYKRGFKDIKISASGIFPCHEPLVKMIEEGVVSKIYSGYYSGPVAKAISQGKCKDICVVSTHGGRPKAIMSGGIKIDYAFVAAPCVDKEGRISGSYGKSACGSLGYAVVDILYAENVIAITDNLVEEIEEKDVDKGFIDKVLLVESIGDAKGIVSGTTQVTKDPIGLKIARDAAEVIVHSGYFKDGLSFQTGAGGVSLAVAEEVKKLMKEAGIKGRLASGGITGYIVDMLEDNLFEELYDVQCFDLKAVESIKKNKNHHRMSSYDYASIDNPNNIASKLDIVILGASEIDLDYNVNVTTGSDGVILGGSGGHADTAAEAKLSIIVSKLVNARVSVIKNRVTTVSTPGDSIDMIVTERGIAVNPKNKDLIEKLKKETKLEIMTIEELKKLAEEITGKPKEKEFKGEVVAISEYRDGTELDLIYRV